MEQTAKIIVTHFNKIQDPKARKAAKVHLVKEWGLPCEMDSVTADLALDWALTTYSTRRMSLAWSA